MNLPRICTPTHPLVYRLYRAAAGKFCVMDIFSAVGNTPLLALHHICPGKERNRRIKIFGKAEFLNPGGSVKDRAAKAMLTAGLRSGKLRPGKAILDATSGSTGISYCIMAAQIASPVILCMSKGVSRTSKRIIKAYGGTIIETDPLQGSE